MPFGRLHIHQRPRLEKATLLMGFSGWMNGGDVSTMTVEYLIEKLNARYFAEIEPEGFYINNFPGSMELAALFRPHTKISNGLVTDLEMPSNKFYCDDDSELIFFLGQEPNLQWHDFAEDIFSLCSEFNVHMIYFIGSIAGLVPHTRKPRLFCSVSDRHLKKRFEKYGLQFSNYEGPASIITYLMLNAKRHGLSMASIVATIPAYLQGQNPKCIEAVTRWLAALLELEIDFDGLEGT
ncbi:MAG: PAC2 family protein [Planctomycetota bacterium]|jgi:proteasome assembly chaperone (PAC2) family protein